MAFEAVWWVAIERQEVVPLESFPTAQDKEELEHWLRNQGAKESHTLAPQTWRKRLVGLPGDTNVICEGINDGIFTIYIRRSGHSNGTAKKG